MSIRDEIRQYAEKYASYTAENLSRLVRTKSYSSKEEDVCRLIVKLCEEAGFDEVRIDGLGSVIARVGNGPKKLAFDAHIDTVEVGNIKNWNFDPFSGEIKDGLVMGRGASDQKGGAASMITAGRILKELGYSGDYSVYFTFTVMEEDLTFAMNNLPLRTENNSKISGAMARHYLGELYLATAQPEKAIEILKPLVECTEYRLMTERFGDNASNPGCPFIDVFRTPMYADGNMEVLYAFVNTETENSAWGTAEVYIKSTYKNYYSNDGIINKSNMEDPDYTSGAATWPQAFWINNGGKGAGRCVPSRGALRLYNYKGQGTNDDRISDYAMVWTINERGADGVLREFRYNGEAVIDTIVTNEMLDDTKTTIKKYNWPTTRKWDYVPPLIANGDKDGCYQDIVYLRLADTYLLYAEALYKTGQYTDAIKWINAIRNRSNAVSITETDLINGGLDLILDERSRELLSEEERRHTLIRVSQENGGDERDVNNYFKRRTRQLNEITGRDSRGMNDYNTPVLFPIPQEFIDSNTGRQLENNPGYL